MSNMTRMDEQSLREFATAVETFMTNINNHCNVLESGLTSCQRYMKDENSQSAIQKGYQVTREIKACLNPAQQLHEKIMSMIQVMNSIEGM